MKGNHLRLSLAVAALAAARFVFANVPSALAAPKQVLVGTVLLETGQPATKGLEVDFRDAAGTLKSTMLPKDGSYSFDTSGMQPPILIWNGSLASYSLTGSGIANINAITDLLVNQIYQTQGTSPSVQIGSGSPITISGAQLGAGKALIDSTFLQPSLSYKITPHFDYFGAKMPLKGPSVQFLQGTTFGGTGTASETAHIVFSGVTFDATFEANQSAGESTSQWMSQTSNGLSGSFYWSRFPAGDAAQTSYTGVGNLLVDYWGILHHEGKFLDNFNLNPVFSNSYLNDGKDLNTATSFIATEFRNFKVQSLSPGIINYFQAGQPDVNHNLIGVDYNITKTVSGLMKSEIRTGDFICDNLGACLFYGNQWNAGVDIRTRLKLTSLTSTPPSPESVLGASVSAPHSSISNPTVSDANHDFWNDNSFPSPSTKEVTLKPIHNGPTQTFSLDRYRLMTDFNPPTLEYDDLFSFDTGDVHTYKTFALGYTNEPINLIKPSLTGGHQISDLSLGKALKLQWTLPTSYVLKEIRLDGTACNSNGDTQDFESKPIKLTATTGSLIPPKMVNSLSPTGVSINLDFRGPFGQNSSVKYQWGSCP